MKSHSHIEELMDAHGDYLKRTAVMVTGDVQLAEDLTQETFISYYKHSDRFKGECSHRTYLYRILMNHIKMHARKNKHYVPSFGLEGQMSFESDTVAAMDLQVALSKLKEDYRMVVWLHYYEDLTTGDIAKIIGVTQSGVKMRLKRAKEELKAHLCHTRNHPYPIGGETYETYTG